MIKAVIFDCFGVRLLIGDHEADLHGVRTVGMQTILYRSFPQPRQGLRAILEA